MPLFLFLVSGTAVKNTMMGKATPISRALRVLEDNILGALFDRKCQMAIGRVAFLHRRLSCLRLPRAMRSRRPRPASATSCQLHDALTAATLRRGADDAIVATPAFEQ